MATYASYSEAQRAAGPDGRVLRKGGQWVVEAVPAPSLVGEGISYAQDLAKQGKIDITALLSNTGKDLVARNGKENVRPLYGQDGQVVGYEYRFSDAGKWHRIDGETEARKLLVLNQEQRLAGAEMEGSSGSDWATRAAASFKRTQEGVGDFLRKNYGRENVEPYFDPKSGDFVDFMVRDSKDKPFRRFDPDFKFGQMLRDLPLDVADVTGDVVESLPGAISSAVGARMFPQSPTKAGLAFGAAGDLAGSAIREGLAKAVPGEDAISNQERLALAATNVAAGAGGELLGAGARGLMGMTQKPLQNIAQTGIDESALRAALKVEQQAAPEIGQQAAEAAARPLATGAKEMTVDDLAMRGAFDENIKRGQELSKEIGVRFTPGQLSKNPALLALEQATRQNAEKPLEMQVMRIADDEAIKNLSNYTNKVIEKQFSDSIGGAEAGPRIAKAFDAYTKKLIDNRSKVAREMFKAAYDEMGGARIPVDNVKASIESVLAGMPKDMMGPSDMAVKRQLEKWLNVIDTNEGAIDVRSVQSQLESWGAGAAGKENLFSQQVKGPRQQGLAGMLYRAMQQDLDEAVGANIGGQGLKAARDTYRILSREIEESRTTLVDSALKKLEVGSADEIVGAWSRKSTSAGLLQKTFAVLDKADPELAIKARGEVVRDILGTADAAITGEARGHTFSLPKLRSALANKQNDAKLKAILEPQSYEAFQKVREAAVRLADTGGAGDPVGIGSPTARYLSAMGVLNGKSSLTMAAIEKANEVLAPKNISNIIANPESSEILLGVMDPRKKWTSQGMMRALSQMSRIALQGQTSETVGIQATTPFVDPMRGGFAP